ncbi:toxin-antitoxin system TumE family protein [Brevundimonas sp.]|uniref:toxin-antitoxin system TumE family protein n=1 Tax=Brevundimonas sp. TaxID=1871086 RepID=UPI003A8FC87A
MKAVGVLHERKVVGDDAFVEIIIWSVPRPVPGSTHGFKYSLALIVNHRCVLRYDNERGKGDHRHIDDQQFQYRFESLSTLLADFWKDVEACVDEHRNLQRSLE